MSVSPSLSDYQSLASTMEAELDALALRQRTQAAHLHLVRAVGMIHAAVREIGAAIAHEQLRPASAPSIDAPLTVEVVSPGAYRADELVRRIPDNVLAVSTRYVTVHLGTSLDAAGARIACKVMRRNGWRQAVDGMWHRPGYGAAARSTPERPR